MWSTEFRSEEEEEKDPCPRVSSTESLPVKVFQSSRARDPSELLLKKESVGLCLP